MNTLDLVPPYKPPQPRRATAAAAGLDQELPTDTYTRDDLEATRRRDREQHQHPTEDVEPEPDLVGQLADLVNARRAPWRQQAACRGLDTRLFFPGRGEDTHTPAAICAACPVAVECREAHLAEKYGIFGGLSERERRRIRRERANEGSPATRKRCPRCAQTKTASEFWNSTREKDGLHGWCKACANQQKRDARQQQGAA